jgi:acetyl-CoA synthetase
MESDTAIMKRLRAGTLPPNLDDHERARQAFTWEAARAELARLPGGRGLNIAHEAVDRHAVTLRRTRVALRCIAKTAKVMTTPTGIRPG